MTSSVTMSISDSCPLLARALVGRAEQCVGNKHTTGSARDTWLFLLAFVFLFSAFCGKFRRQWVRRAVGKEATYLFYSLGIVRVVL